MDILVDPNGLSVNQADPDYLLNSIQMDYLNSVATMNDISENLSRIRQKKHLIFKLLFVSQLSSGLGSLLQPVDTVGLLWPR